MREYERFPEARLDDVRSYVDFSRLRPIKLTRHAGLLFEDPFLQRSSATVPATPWSHSITVTLCSSPQTNLIAVLRSKALDPDAGRIFGRPAIPAEGLMRLLRCAASCTTDERFESLIFEAFELASRRSMDDGRRGRLLRMQRLKRFIEQESHTDLKLERMALVAGLSTFACVRQFKEVTGTTPHAYVLECRIQKARALLCTHGTSVAAVARAAGFTDQAYFARIFKRSTGMTPMQYRHSANVFG